ncbi:MAG TPA: flavin reductase family protein [Acidimicrobiales bacterium]|nr:flavin reductase family protein [Acidimicrobiales bacterium]
MAEPSAAFDAARYRQVMGHFCTGVVIVAATTDAGPVGWTAQSLTALSLDPPLISICPARNSSRWPRIAAAGAFCVNVLGEDQEQLCRAFAIGGDDLFEGIDWHHTSVTGSPRLDGSLGWVDCRIITEHDAGDHLIVVASVEDMGLGDEAGPLLFYRGGYGRFES